MRSTRSRTRREEGPADTAAAAPIPAARPRPTAQMDAAGNPRARRQRTGALSNELSVFTNESQASFTTPSPMAVVGSNAEHHLSLKRKRTMFTEVDASRSILENLPRDVIGRIFFTGYLSTVEVGKRVVRVCKDFNAISKTHTRAVDMRGLRVTSNYMSSLGNSGLKSLRFLDLSYCKMTDYTVTEIEKSLGKTLIGLSLRGTAVTNAGLIPLASMKQLEYVDVSKSSIMHKDLIDNEGLTCLISLPNLKLVNIAGTSATDAAIDTGLRKWRKLEHFSMQCCPMGRNTAYELCQLPLKSLDITGSGADDYDIKQIFTPG